MPKTIEGKDSTREEAKQKFADEIEKLKDLKIPENIRNFLLMIENIKQDEQALQILREEILKNHGQ
jgi:hypothetical protein